MQRSDQNKENKVGNHYVAYMKDQKMQVKKLLNVKVATSTDTALKAGPSHNRRSTRPRTRRPKFFADILESEEEDIPSPAYSPHRPKRKISVISKIKKGIAEKKEAKKPKEKKAAKKPKEKKEVKKPKEKKEAKKPKEKKEAKKPKEKKEAKKPKEEKKAKKPKEKKEAKKPQEKKEAKKPKAKKEARKKKNIENPLDNEKLGQNKVEEKKVLTLREYFSQWTCD